MVALLLKVAERREWYHTQVARQHYIPVQRLLKHLDRHHNIGCIAAAVVLPIL